ncbi:hypothetical protein GE09DRAFT_500306 [Coniochaeta sp. 2T2.1]|nr:hypothetical protein GE09DRAFT_500306 [Coniochaeta sp. 2T2.1]
MANITNCPLDMIPDIESLPVPHDVNLMIIPGANASSPQMVSCCAPNQVQVVNDCWLWCEIPKSYYDQNGGNKDGVQASLSSLSEGKSRKHNDRTADYRLAIQRRGSDREVVGEGIGCRGNSFIWVDIRDVRGEGCRGRRRKIGYVLSTGNETLSCRKRSRHSSPNLGCMVRNSCLHQ